MKYTIDERNEKCQSMVDTLEQDEEFKNLREEVRDLKYKIDRFIYDRYTDIFKEYGLDINPQFNEDFVLYAYRTDVWEEDYEQDEEDEVA